MATISTVTLHPPLQSMHCASCYYPRSLFSQPDESLTHTVLHTQGYSRKNFTEIIIPNLVLVSSSFMDNVTIMVQVARRRLEGYHFINTASLWKGIGKGSCQMRRKYIWLHGLPVSHVSNVFCYQLRAQIISIHSTF